jgi:hypothetical protein
VVPDGTNLATVNVNEYLKANFNIISNNLQLDSLPNNLDFFAQFYIEFSESYDSSDGTNVTTFTSDTVSDQSTFEGFSCNSMLPFKNRYSGYMSEYVTDNQSILQKFLTSFSSPYIFPAQYFDLSFTNPGLDGLKMKRELYKNNVLISTLYDSIPNNGAGVYRWQISQSGNAEDYVNCTLVVNSSGGAFNSLAFSSGFLISGISSYRTISETKTITFTTQCYKQQYDISWLNNNSGFDYWRFTGFATHSIEIQEIQTQMKNIFTSWPNSWGELANTVKSESKRISFTKSTIRSQNVTKDQLDSIAMIKTSPLVQIVNSRYDTRTVLIDTGSFDIRKDGDKTFNVSFNIVYTNQNPNQQI